MCLCLHVFGVSLSCSASGPLNKKSFERTKSCGVLLCNRKTQGTFNCASIPASNSGFGPNICLGPRPKSGSCYLTAATFSLCAGISPDVEAASDNHAVTTGQ